MHAFESLPTTSAVRYPNWLENDRTVTVLPVGHIISSAPLSLHDLVECQPFSVQSKTVHLVRISGKMSRGGVPAKENCLRDALLNEEMNHTVLFQKLYRQRKPTQHERVTELYIRYCSCLIRSKVATKFYFKTRRTNSSNV